MKEESVDGMKPGDLIHIFHMEGEPAYTDRQGKVEFIDDIGQIHGTWGGCALIPGKDHYEKQEEK